MADDERVDPGEDSGPATDAEATPSRSRFGDLHTRTYEIPTTTTRRSKRAAPSSRLVAGRHELRIVSPLRPDRDDDDPERRHVIPFWK